MRKLLGYIPLDPEEHHIQLSKLTDVIKIEGQWFKLAEVWIPGTPLIQTKCGYVPAKDLSVDEVIIIPGRERH